MSKKRSIQSGQAAQRKRMFQAEGDLTRWLHDQVARQVPKHIIVADICDIISRMPLTSDDVMKLYKAITGRFQHKSCVRCGRLFANIVEGGIWTHDDKSIYHGKQVCIVCRAIIKEKEKENV